MKNLDYLRSVLHRIDGRGYKAYIDIQGAYETEKSVLYIDHVQGDPFASPSKIRARMSRDATAIPFDLYRNATRRVALEDFLSRRINRIITRIAQGNRGSGKSGLIAIDAGGQEVIERTSIVVRDDWIEARLAVGLPAAGRKVLGRQAELMLCCEIPEIIERGLSWKHLPQEEARAFVECVENQEFIRERLDELGLIGFIADGAVLPRESGVSDRPLESDKAVPFRSPDSLCINIDSLPNPISIEEGESTTISGMGIPRGVTLIAGGGYHGKSTLLRALERGVYPHIPGDGREYVVTSRDTMKIRAEDGRRVERVDISPFINNLPYGRSTTSFSSDDASGSTSQAANIIEALEVGAKVLLLDEDTSATNFMVRDARMQALISKENEPITPFLDRVRELYEKQYVSTVLVMGGCGDYIDVADTVILMREYLPYDVTLDAKGIAREIESRRREERVGSLSDVTERYPLPESFDPSRGRRDVKIDAKAIDLILFGSDRIDLRCVEQLVDFSQTRAIGCAIHLAVERFMDGKTSMREVVDAVERFFDERGLDELDPFHRSERHPGDFARPRKHEIAAAINRLRSVRMRQK